MYCVQPCSLRSRVADTPEHTSAEGIRTPRRQKPREARATPPQKPLGQTHPPYNRSMHFQYHATICYYNLSTINIWDHFRPQCQTARWPLSRPFWHTGKQNAKRRPTKLGWLWLDHSTWWSKMELTKIYRVGMTLSGSLHMVMQNGAYKT